MKSMIVKKIREEFGLRKIGGKKLEMYNFYELCGLYKRLKQGEEIR